MEREGRLLSNAIAAHVKQANTVANLRLDLDGFSAAAWIDSKVIGPYGNREQRDAAVTDHLRKNTLYIAKRAEHDEAVARRGVLEGAVELQRAKLSIAKRNAEMAVALMRSTITE